ncbi:MAG: hypothetical protein KGL93_11070 [Gemmatimonadota bacterium]|nr:hypothetical protein [Gemmatimonadota bacterium]
MRRLIAIAALLAAGIPGAAARAQESGDLTTRWAWKVPAGDWFTLRSLNGRITAHRAEGDSVVVTAVKHVRRGDPAYVRYDVQKYGDDQQNVLLCALWGTDARCSPTSYDANDDEGRGRRNQVAVEFDVAVPAGVKIAVHSVNSDVAIAGVTSEVHAGTVNGRVNVETDGGPVSANSVNGSVHASMLRYHPTQDMRFNTVNGSVVVELPNDVDADVELSTVNGRFTTDFPVTLSGRIDPRHLRATLGKGGPRITMHTVNGNVELRKH